MRFLWLHFFGILGGFPFQGLHRGGKYVIHRVLASARVSCTGRMNVSRWAFFYLLLFDAFDYTRFSLLFSQLLLRSSLSRLGAVCFFEFGVPLAALYNSSPLIRYLQIARR